MPQKVEWVTSYDEACKVARDIQKRSIEEVKKENGFSASNVTIVKGGFDINTNEPEALVETFKIRPLKTTAVTGSRSTVSGAALNALDYHILSDKVEEMSSPFVGDSISDNERRPKNDLLYTNDHMILVKPSLEESLFDVDVDFSALSLDVESTKNLTIHDLDGGTQGGIEDLTEGKIAYGSSMGELKRIAGDVLRHLGRSRTSVPLNGLSPMGVHDAIERAVLHYENMKGSTPKDALVNLGILFRMASDLELAETGVSASGKDVFDDTFDADGWSFPGIVENKSDLTDPDKFGIGTVNYLFDY
jgi:hypothetical protein